MANKKLKQIRDKLNLCDYYLRRFSNIGFCCLIDFYFDFYIGFSIPIYLYKKFYHLETIEYNNVTL